MLKIKVTLVRASELRPGDLFSRAGPEYWQGPRPGDAIGERVYIRTEAPCRPEERDEPVYRIEVVPTYEPQPIDGCEWNDCAQPADGERDGHRYCGDHLAQVDQVFFEPGEDVGLEVQP